MAKSVSTAMLLKPTPLGGIGLERATGMGTSFSACRTDQGKAQSFRGLEAIRGRFATSERHQGVASTRITSRQDRTT